MLAAPGANAAASTVDRSECPSCGEERVGTYCEACGQTESLPIRPVGDALEQAWGEIRRRGKRHLRTLTRLLGSPGTLSEEYVDGRLDRYVDPVKLFVELGVASYLLTRLLPPESSLFGVGPVIFGEESGIAEWLYAIGSIPLAASAHWLALKERRPLFMEHAVFMVHVMAFGNVLAPLQGLLDWLSIGHPVLATASALVAPILFGGYWLLALRRFYRLERRELGKAALKVYLAVAGLLIPFALFFGFLFGV